MVKSVRKVFFAPVALSCCMALMTPALAQYNNGNGYNAAPYNATPYNSAPYQGGAGSQYQGQVAYVPAGMVLPVTLSTSISSSVARPGDLVQGTLTQPLMLGNAMVPAGSIVSGQVTNAKSGGFLTKSGKITIRFNMLRTPSGAQTPINAHIVGDIGKYAQKGGDSGTVAGEGVGNKAAQTVIRGGIGAGLGAALGTAVGAIASRGHNVGTGAWSGAAIGGGAGVADALVLRKGRDVIIPSGTNLQVQLDTPATLTAAPGPYSGAF